MTTTEGCDRCDGTGAVWVEDFAGPHQRPCKKCKGAGRIPTAASTHATTSAASSSTGRDRPAR